MNNFYIRLLWPLTLAAYSKRKKAISRELAKWLRLISI